MYDYHCGRCGGLVPEPMKAYGYGYSGRFCHCQNPEPPKQVSVTTTTIANTHTTPEVEEIVKQPWEHEMDLLWLDGAPTLKAQKDLIRRLITTLTTKHQEELEKAVEAERERIRKVASTRTRKLKIGQNEYARKALNLTEKQIDDHNDFCEAWEEGYDAAKDDVMKALTPTKTDKQTEV